jgi:hypothetical protein
MRLYTVIPPFQTLAINPQAEWFLEPTSPIVAIDKPQPELIVILTLGEFGSSILSGSGWSPIQPLWRQSISPSMRFPRAFSACQLGIDTHLFYVTEDARVWTSRRRNGYIWADRKPAGGDLRIYPFSRITAALRSINDVYVSAFDTSGRLVALQWATTDPSWPPNVFHVIATDPLFPGGSLASVSLGRGEIVLIAIGKDLRPWRYILRLNRARLSWTAGQPLGRPENLVSPQTQLGLEQINDDTMAVFAMGIDGMPYRYLLTRNTEWRADTRVPVLTQPAVDGFAPNPFSDLATVQTGAPQGIALAFAGVAPGAVAAITVAGSGGSPRALAS